MESIGQLAALAARQMQAGGEASQRLPSRARRVSHSADAPPTLDIECDVALPRRLFSAWIPSDGAREIRRALNASERDQLEARYLDLDDALQPFPPEQTAQVEAEISAMLSGFRAMRAQGADALAMVEVTRHVLKEFPLWAIARGCKQIATRKAYVDDRKLDPRYAPNDTEIYAVVEGEVKSYRQARDSAKALLSAPVEQPAPVRPSRDEIEQMLGRTLGAGTTAKPDQAPPDPIRPGYTARVMADLEDRKRRRDDAAKVCGNE